LTDGVFVLRSPQAGDDVLLIAGRDAEFHRFIGEGSPDPKPTAVVTDDQAEVVGWIDYDTAGEWLGDGEVNVGYSVFRRYRGAGIAKRSVELLLTEFLAHQDGVTTATLLIDPANTPSIAVAQRTGFVRHGEVDSQIFYKRPL